MLPSAVTNDFGSYRVSWPIIALVGPAQILRGWGSDPRIYTEIVGFGCYFAAETARRGRGRPFAKGGPAMLSAPPGGSTTRPHGLPSRCSAKFGETDP